MSLILGILDSGGVAGAATSYESIATVTVGSGGSATVEFTSIPNTYQHLQVRAIARTNGNDDAYKVRFNGDTGSNYRYNHYLGGDGGTAFVGSDGSGTFNILYYAGSANHAANIFGTIVFDILDYTSTNKNKTIRYFGAVERNGSGSLNFGSALWYATPAAITSITIFPAVGTQFNQYTQFALYGIKGA